MTRADLDHLHALELMDAWAVTDGKREIHLDGEEEIDSPPWTFRRATVTCCADVVILTMGPSTRVGDPPSPAARGAW